MKKFIAIAGNMGIGKTTLTKKLAEHLNWKPYLEPVAENPYLVDFYQDMPRWAFHSQLYFLGKRIQDHRDLTLEEGSVVQDRSLYENAEVFARNLYNKGFINERDWQTYHQLYESSRDLLPAPDLIIYLRASTDKIMERIKERNRDFEKNIDSGYIDELNDLYDEWMGNFKLSPIISVSYDDLDLKNSETHFASFLEAIGDYVK